MPKLAAATVRLSSVPRCLRHGVANSPLDDAGALAAFLQKAVAALLAEGSSLPDDGSVFGLELCFYLLRDKIAIAAGELPFPTIGHDETLPPLWTPPETGGAHE